MIIDRLREIERDLLVAKARLQGLHQARLELAVDKALLVLGGLIIENSELCWKDGEKK